MNKFSQTGFSLIEMIVVLGISVLLVAVFIGFSNQNTISFIISGERERLINNFNEAKNLALQTFINDITNQKVCGYGIHIAADLKSYTLFRDLPIPKSGECVVAGAYTGNRYYDVGDSDELVGLFNLPNNISFDSPLTSNVFFLPPIPQIVFTPDIVGNDTDFDLRTNDNNYVFGVRVTRAGQSAKN